MAMLIDSELSLAQPIRFLVVEPAYPDLSPRLSLCACIFLDLFRDLTSVFLSVVGDVLSIVRCPR